MNVSLTKHFERYIADLVRAGDYQSSSEVVREALRLLQERHRRLADLRRAIRRGGQSLRSRGGRPFDDRAVDRILARAGADPARAARRAG